jgi:hypothetical protein
MDQAVPKEETDRPDRNRQQDEDRQKGSPPTPGTSGRDGRRLRFRDFRLDA